MKYYKLTEQNNTRKAFGTLPNFISLIPDDIEIEKIVNYGKAYVEKNQFYVPPLKLKGKSSIITNMLPSLAGGFGMSVIADYKLKNIIEKSNYYKMRFTKTVLKDLEDNELPYWFISAEEGFYDAIDFKNSIFFDKKNHMFDEAKWEKLSFEGKDEFLQYEKENDTIIYIDFICLIENVNSDFFAIQFVNNNTIVFFISEKLKGEIEKENMTGMQFLELNERWP
jgi:hypothetical protein